MHLDSISHLTQDLRSGLLCSGPQTKVLGYKILHCEISSAFCQFLYLKSQIVHHILLSNILNPSVP